MNEINIEFRKSKSDLVILNTASTIDTRMIYRCTMMSQLEEPILLMLNHFLYHRTYACVKCVHVSM